MTTSKSSAFSLNTPFIFEMQEINGALFFKTTTQVFATSIDSLATIYASL